MSQLPTHGLELVFMPTESGSCETRVPHFGNTAVENSAQFNVAQNDQVQYSDPLSATSSQIAMITPAEFPQAFTATSTSIPADNPQLFPYQQGTVTPANYPLMFPCNPSQYL